MIFYAGIPAQALWLSASGTITWVDVHIVWLALFHRMLSVTLAVELLRVHLVWFRGRAENLCAEQPLGQEMD